MKFFQLIVATIQLACVAPSQAQTCKYCDVETDLLPIALVETLTEIATQQQRASSKSSEQGSAILFETGRDQDAEYVLKQIEDRLTAFRIKFQIVSRDTFEEKGQHTFLLELPNVSLESLNYGPFEIAHHMKTGYGLLEAEPGRFNRHDSGVGDKKTSGRSSGGNSSDDSVCFDDVNKEWHLNSMKVPAAWQFSEDFGYKTQGEGIVIGQIDTGYSDHEAFTEEGMWKDPDEKGFNTFDGENESDPRDILKTDTTWADPGHGTLLGSLAVSRGTIVLYSGKFRTACRFDEDGLLGGPGDPLANGNDNKYYRVAKDAQSYSACQETCTQDDGCTAFEFGEEGKRCEQWKVPVGLRKPVKGGYYCMVKKTAPRGVAPAAKLFSIRAVNDPVMTEPNIERIEKAFKKIVADKIDVHVVSMSLGYPDFWKQDSLVALSKAICDAQQEQNLIVVAAGGQTARFSPITGVMYPAKFEHVVAIGGYEEAIGDGTQSNEIFRRTKKYYSDGQYGNEIDVSGPARNVCISRYDEEKDSKYYYYGGAGTSLATALTGGVAALWLAHWGRDTLINAFKPHNLNQAFQKGLELSATKVDWKGKYHRKYGHGMIDAYRLLNIDLKTINDTLTDSNTPIGDAACGYYDARSHLREYGIEDDLSPFTDSELEDHSTELAYLTKKVPRDQSGRIILTSLLDKSTIHSRESVAISSSLRSLLETALTKGDEF